MVGLFQYHTNVQFVRRNIQDQVFVIVENNINLIYDIIRKDQILERGIAGDGEIIGRYRSPKPGKNIGDPVNLFDTGELYNSWDAIFSSDSVTIFPDKFNLARELEARYNETTFQFTEENKQRVYTEIIEPKLVEWVQRQLQK